MLWTNVLTFHHLSTSSLEMPQLLAIASLVFNMVKEFCRARYWRSGFLTENSSGTGCLISLQSTYLFLLLILYVIICSWNQDLLLCQMPSISLLLTKISVWLTYGKACFEGCQIVNWDLLTKLGLWEPWRIADGDKVINCFYHHFLLIHNSLYISKHFQSQRIQGLNRVPN